MLAQGRRYKSRKLGLICGSITANFQRLPSSRSPHIKVAGRRAVQVRAEQQEEADVERIVKDLTSKVRMRASERALAAARRGAGRARGARRERPSGDSSRSRCTGSTALTCATSQPPSIHPTTHALRSGTASRTRRAS